MATDSTAGCRWGAALGLGQVQAQAAGHQRAVMMKITSSTSITSISGVMLMSLIGWG
jgi:hypothetical protein